MGITSLEGMALLNAKLRIATALELLFSPLVDGSSRLASKLTVRGSQLRSWEA